LLGCGSSSKSDDATRSHEALHAPTVTSVMAHWISSARIGSLGARRFSRQTCTLQLRRCPAALQDGKQAFVRVTAINHCTVALLKIVGVSTVYPPSRRSFLNCFLLDVKGQGAQTGLIEPIESCYIAFVKLLLPFGSLKASWESSRPMSWPNSLHTVANVIYLSLLSH